MTHYCSCAAAFPLSRTPPALLAAVAAGGLVPLYYVDDAGAPTEAYPFNPNGSSRGIAGLTSPDGRHLAMMPHPERLHAVRPTGARFTRTGHLCMRCKSLKEFSNINGLPPPQKHSHLCRHGIGPGCLLSGGHSRLHRGYACFRTQQRGQTKSHPFGSERCLVLITPSQLSRTRPGD